MTSEMKSGALPRLIRKSDGREFRLTARLTTLGSSPQCGIVIRGANVPPHVARIMFTEGKYTVAAVSREPPLRRNGEIIIKPTVLTEGDLLTVQEDTYLYTGGFAEPGKSISTEANPLRRFIGALSTFSRTGDSDVRFELLAGIAQLLGSDGARLVIEDEGGCFTTIARYPANSGLDRFSQRAITWAKQQGTTILMHDTDWGTSEESKGSLELNKVGSILCRPIYEGDKVRGYLYLDKQQDKTVFTDHDRRILDDVGPVFGDLLALYERSNRQQETIARLQKNIETNETPIIYECETMRRSIDLAVKFAATDSTVLITGETGTGKELFARLIHRRSNRSEKDFCAINCGALPENLIESELFGHEKGSFTGAYQKKTGLFERADGGTVFLDEIGDMPLNLQVKLLRVLQEAELTPVGSTSTVKVNVRIIAATNRVLADEVKRGSFREDLFYRLNVLEVAVAPLRSRHRDVLLLADFMIKKYTGRFGIPEKALSLPAQARLLKYPWPGNIRQLENVLQKALLMSKGTLVIDSDLNLPDDAAGGAIAKPVEGGASPDAAVVVTLKAARAAAEKQCINEALARAGGNVSIAARLLDTDRKWLTKLMKLHGVGGA